MEEVKDEEKMLKDDKQKFLQEHKRMKMNLGMSNEDMEYLFGAKAQIENLVSQGYLDQHGQPIVKK